jgi:Na+/phosphate symporter
MRRVLEVLTTTGAEWALVAVTSIIQSSSASNRDVVGFVNAGL